MKTVLVDYKKPTSRFENLSLCLGYFDGVHVGHQSLIKYARKNAKYILGLLTFNKPISTLVENGKSKEVLTSLDDRFKIISKFGVDYYFVLQIDKEFVKLSDLEFIEFLKKMNVKEIFVGKDFRYGENVKGTVYTLQDYFDVKVIDIENVDGEKVSTQSIGKLIKDGNIKKANDLLGHNYNLVGTIVHGNHIGSSLGFPTINLKLSDNYLLPKFGVYKTICYLDNVPHVSITNVGVKPTIGEKNVPNVEVHLINFNKEIYGDVVNLEFVDFIREEKKFSSLNELKNQIQIDIESLNGKNK